MSAFTRLRVLRVMLVLVLVGASGWLVFDDRAGEGLALLFLGSLKERHAIRAFLAGRRALQFERAPFEGAFVRVAVPGGWTAKNESDGSRHTVELEGRGGWIRVTWLEPAKDGSTLDLATLAFETSWKDYRRSDVRSLESLVAGCDAAGVEATISSWRTLSRVLVVVARPRAEAALLVSACWEWAVPRAVVDRCFTSLHLTRPGAL